jgi:hypothetical protein
MLKLSAAPLAIALACLLAGPALAVSAEPGTDLPDPGSWFHSGQPSQSAPLTDEDDLCEGWPIHLGTPGAGFPYTPTLFDVTGDGAQEIFFTGGETFGVKGDGTFLPGWPETEHLYMGYGTNGQMPGPSVADLTGNGDIAVLWSQRDWWAGSAHMWCFNGRLPDGSDLGGFPQYAPDDYSNALASPFVLGDADGDGDLEAWSAHTLGNTGDYYRLSGFDHTGTRLFTRDLEPSEQILNLYFGDLAGDGQDAFFAVTLLGGTFRLIAFAADGSLQAGYPVELYTPGAGYLMFGPPLVLDMDGDGALEIIMGVNISGTSYAMAVKFDGTPMPGSPITIATQSQLFYLGLGDVLGNHEPELIAFDNHLGSGYRVHVLHLMSGEVLPGWPVALANWPQGFPTVVDVDNDGVQDIVLVTGGGELFALSGTGAVLDGFPRTMASASISGVAAGDIDGDGYYELVAVTWDGWAYAWNTQGAVGDGNADWPLRGIDARNTGVFRSTSGVISIGDQPDPGADDQAVVPAALAISSVAPNPFNPRTTVRLDLPRSETVALAVHDLSGRLVRTLWQGTMQAGRHAVVWDGLDERGQPSPSGTYLVRLVGADGAQRAVKITLSK